MSTYLNSLLLITAQIAMLFTPFSVSSQEAIRQANWPISTAIQTKAGQNIPAGAFGVVQIDVPRVANLLQLRGVMGRGTAIMRSADSRDCLSLPVRFIAGDFGGDSISTHTTKTIRLIIRSAKVSTALARGEDVVSDMYDISSQMNASDADIVIESGLSGRQGFVLNPGTSVVADIFGTKAFRTNCSAL